MAKAAGSAITYYVYGADGQVVSEYDTGGHWERTQIHFGGKLTVLYSGVTTAFYHQDHLGSTRLITIPNASVYDNMDYLPYGEQIAGGTATEFKFTGKERDSESGLDNFGARYNSSSLGRFMSPDDFTKDSDVSDPQSWNKYSYARNNPLKYTDPTGGEATVF